MSPRTTASTACAGVPRTCRQRSGASTARDLGGRFLPVFEMVRSWCLIGAAAAGVPAIDAVFTDLADLDGLRAESSLAAAMGFAGKITIHPSQIDIVNEAFTPSSERIADAAELIAEFERHAADGRLSFLHNGQMVDAPHLARAKAVLARAGITAMKYRRARRHRGPGLAARARHDAVRRRHRRGRGAARSSPPASMSASTCSTAPTSTPAAAPRRSSAVSSRPCATTSCSPPRSGSRAARGQPTRHVAGPRPAVGRGQPDPARHRPHRPLLPAPLRPAHRHRPHAAHARRARHGGQDPAHRGEQLRRLAGGDRARPLCAERLGADRRPAADVQPRQAPGRSRAAAARPVGRSGRVPVQPARRRTADGQVRHARRAPARGGSSPTRCTARATATRAASSPPPSSPRSPPRSVATRRRSPSRGSVATPE